MTTLYVVITSYEDVEFTIELITANMALAHQKSDDLKLDILQTEKLIGSNQPLAEAWDHYMDGEYSSYVMVEGYEHEPGLEPESDPLTPWLS